MTVNYSGALQSVLRSGASLGAYRTLVKQNENLTAQNANLIEQTRPKPNISLKSAAAESAKADNQVAQEAGYPNAYTMEQEQSRDEFEADQLGQFLRGVPGTIFEGHENDNDLPAKAAQTATARGVQAVVQNASQKARMTEYYQNLVSQRFGSLSELERAKSTRSGRIDK